MLVCYVSTHYLNMICLTVTEMGKEGKELLYMSPRNFK